MSINKPFYEEIAERIISMKKKIIIALMSVLCVVGLAACTDKSKEEKDGTSATEKTPAQTMEATKIPTAEPTATLTPIPTEPVAPWITPAQEGDTKAPTQRIDLPADIF